jgi:hypothetical protein
VRLKFVGFCVLFLAQIAHGRVFDFSREKFASYFLLNYASSRIADLAFVGESSANQYSETFKTQPGGEFGFIYASRYFAWRFGLEIIKPATLQSKASLNGGSNLYVVSSDLTSLMPKLGFEINWLTRQEYRLLVFGQIGQASLAAKNTYTALTIAPNTDFSTEWKAAANAKGAGLAIEYYAFDLTTIMFEVGYRDLKYTDIKYSKEVTGFSGAVAAGDQVKDLIGKNREIDFSGPYAAVAARFWLF